MNSVDNLRELREFVWCDHVALSIQGYGPEYTHAAIIGGKAVHIVAEQGKVKFLCHSCFTMAMQERFNLGDLQTRCRN